jgi:hypothetical protein
MTIYLVYAVLIGIYSVQQLRINPEISRILASSDKSVTGEFADPFMANFSFVNNSTLISLFIVFFIKQSPKTTMRLAAIMLLALNVYLLICAQYSIALFLFVAFLLVILAFFEKKQNSKYSTVRAFLIIVACFMILPFFGDLLIKLAEVIPEGYVERRVRSIGEVFDGGVLAADSDLADRISLYKLSITTFFRNFLTGVGGAVYGAEGRVGAHSQILDNFAYYGVVFGSQFVWYLISVYKNGVSFLQLNFKRIYRLIFTVYMIQCVLNTSYNEEMLFVIFFVIPSMIYLTQRSQNSLGGIDLANN